jgi:hypothetical protein
VGAAIHVEYLAGHLACLRQVENGEEARNPPGSAVEHSGLRAPAAFEPEVLRIIDEESSCIGQ